MRAKDEKIKEAIEDVLGSSRKGRIKTILLVRRKYPDLGTSQIRRVYEKYGFSLTKKLRRRIKNNPANPISIPMAENEYNTTQN